MISSVFSEKTLELIRQYRGTESLEGRVKEPLGTLMEISVDFAKYTEEYLLGGIMSRPGLSMRERSLIIIAALAVNRYEFVAGGHMRWALNVGITREETIEVILQITHYGDWPIGKEMIDLIETAYPGYFKTMVEGSGKYVQPNRRLSLREHTLVHMGALAARRFGNRLKKKMRFALDMGITREEILETIMQVTPFSGCPVGVEAIRVSKEVISLKHHEKSSYSGQSEFQEKGRTVLRQLMGGSVEDETFELIRYTFPDFMKIIIEEHLFGQIWSRSILSLRDRCMITLAVLIAFRFNQDLKAHMQFALNSGLTKEEVFEIIMHSANYTCWGSGVGANYYAQQVFETGMIEKSPKSVSSELQKRGKDIINQLRRQEERDELFNRIGKIAPDFMKVITEEHLFGEVWSRPGLVLRDRCMITLAIFIAGMFNDELRSQMRYALNVGISREEIVEIILHTANYTCWGAGVRAMYTCKDILVED